MKFSHWDFPFNPYRGYQKKKREIYERTKKQNSIELIGDELCHPVKPVVTWKLSVSVYLQMFCTPEPQNTLMFRAPLYSQGVKCFTPPPDLSLIYEIPEFKKVTFKYQGDMARLWEMCDIFVQNIVHRDQ